MTKHWTPDPFSQLGSREQPAKPKRRLFGRRWRFDPRAAGMVLLVGALLGLCFDVVSDGIARWSDGRPALSKQQSAALLAKRNRERLGEGGKPIGDDPPDNIYEPGAPKSDPATTREASAGTNVSAAAIDPGEPPGADDAAAADLANGL